MQVFHFPPARTCATHGWPLQLRRFLRDWHLAVVSGSGSAGVQHVHPRHTIHSRASPRQRIPTLQKHISGIIMVTYSLLSQ